MDVGTPYFLDEGTYLTPFGAAFGAFRLLGQASERDPNAWVSSVRIMKQLSRARADAQTWLALVAVLLGVVVTSLDNTVVNVALPTISRDLHAGLSATAWFVDAYVLSFAALLLTGGRLADTFGRRRTFIAGVVTFTVASAAAGLAGNAESLIAARAVQGIGSALLTPPTLAIISHAFRNKDQRETAIGLWGSIGALAFAIGPLIGGMVTQQATWRCAFFLNVPLGVVAVLLATRFVAESWDTSSHRRIDVAGLVLATCSLLPLTFVLIKGYEIGWRSPIVLGLLGLSALSATAFVVVERRIREPVFDLSFLRRGPFAATTLVTLIIGVAWFGAFLFTSLFLQQVRHNSPVTAGAALLPWLVALLVVAPVTGHIARFVSPRLVVTIGLILLGFGFYLLSHVDERSGYAALIPGLLLGGTGAALTIPLNGLALGAVDSRKAGVASGIFNTARETGGCLGVALTSAVVAYGKQHSAAAGFSREHAFAVGYGNAMTVAAMLTFGAGMVTVIALRPAYVLRPGGGEKGGWLGWFGKACRGLRLPRTASTMITIPMRNSTPPATSSVILNGPSQESLAASRALTSTAGLPSAFATTIAHCPPVIFQFNVCVAAPVLRATQNVCWPGAETADTAPGWRE